MNFEVTINTEVRTYEQFQDAHAWITERMAQWNNFEPQVPLSITIKKVDSGTETLGIHVEDEFKVADLFGG